MVSTAVITPSSTWNVPLHRPLRFPAAALLAATAAIHIPLISEHLSEAPYIGVLFIALAVACVTLSVLLLVCDCTPVWLATAGVSGAAVLAYVLSRSVGLPQIGDDIGNWLDPLGVAALIVETLAVVLTVRVLRSSTGSAGSTGSTRLAA